MDGIVFFAASMAGMFFGTVFLAAYVFAFYRLGIWLGDRSALNQPLWRGVVPIALGWGPISIWPFLTDWDIFLKMGIAMGFYFLGACPTAMGFGAAVEVRHAQAKRRFTKNVDDWLGEWECEPATFLGEEED